MCRTFADVFLLATRAKKLAAPAPTVERDWTCFMSNIAIIGIPDIWGPSKATTYTLWGPSKCFGIQLSWASTVVDGNYILNITAPDRLQSVAANDVVVGTHSIPSTGKHLARVFSLSLPAFRLFPAPVMLCHLRAIIALNLVGVSPIRA